MNKEPTRFLDFSDASPLCDTNVSVTKTPMGSESITKKGIRTYNVAMSSSSLNYSMVDYSSTVDLTVIEDAFEFLIFHEGPYKVDPGFHFFDILNSSSSLALTRGASSVLSVSSVNNNVLTSDVEFSVSGELGISTPPIIETPAEGSILIVKYRPIAWYILRSQFSIDEDNIVNLNFTEVSNAS